MNPALIGIIGIIVLVLIFLLNMPIAFSMAFAGLIGTWYLISAGVSFNILAREFFNIFSTYTLSCIPMFVLMGTIAANSGISKNLYATGYAFVGQFRGGLALATTIGCALFAAISGSSAAEAAAMAKVALPEMKKYNYGTSLATGSIAAAGTLAILIPPSMGFIVYGFLTQESVGRLFIAGIIPGILLTILFLIIVYIICKLNPDLGPAGQSVSWKEKLKSLSGCIDMVLLFLLVIGGLFAGIFTPTEGGAIGASGALILSLIRRRIGWRGIVESLRDTAIVTSMIFVILAGAFVFGRFMAYSGITSVMIDLLTSGNLSPNAVMWLIFGVYLVGGCFMEFTPLGALTIPTLLPIIKDLGFDPIWFGVYCVVCAEMALITPPVGMNVFVIKAVAPDVPLNTIFKGAVPFVAAQFVLFLVLLYFPKIATFLPNLMMGYK
jgi:tripartite ATP-independent transporter DctM subunit